MGLDGVADIDQTALGAGDGAADDDHVQLCINLNDLQVLDGDLLVAHLTSADLTGEDTGLMGRGAHGTCVTVDRAAAVGHVSAVCTVALDNALIAMALGNTGDIDPVAGCEGVSLDHIAHIQSGAVFQTELLQVLLSLNAGLLQVASLRLGQLGLLDILKAQLDGLVAVGFKICLNLYRTETSCQKPPS